MSGKSSILIQSVVYFLILTFAAHAQRTLDLAIQNGDARLMGREETDYFGRSVATGDVNGDGVADLIVGAYGADAIQRNVVGKTYIFFGGAELSGTIDLDHSQADVAIVGISPGDASGFAVAAGDINGDSYADVIIGAYLADPDGKASAGETYIVWGSDALPQTISLPTYSSYIKITGTYEGANFGFPLATGDINHDSIDDVIIGARELTFSGRDKVGGVFVFFGSSALRQSAQLSMANADLIFIGEASEDHLGRSVAAGDINGDAYDDLILGAYKADPNGRTNAGTAYVIFGGDDLQRVTDLYYKSADLTIYGANAEGALGVSAASGDLNGDGIEDLILGAVWEDASDRVNIGKAYAIFGKTNWASEEICDLAVKPADFYLHGQNQSDELGISVSAGDINGDGVGDLIVGAATALKADESRPGKAYVIFGETALSGLHDLNFQSPDILVAGANNGDNLGWAVAAGDFNDDGVDDLAVGSDLADPQGRSEAGEVHVIFGNAAPEQPVLVSPSQNSYIASFEPDFTWQHSDDLNGDSLSYQLVIKTEGTGDSLVFDSRMHPSKFQVVQPASGDQKHVKFDIEQSDEFTDGSSYTWYVLAFDGKEHSKRSDKWRFTIDTLPPGIDFNPSAEAELGQALNIMAGISDRHSGVQTAKLYYRRGGASAFTEMILLHVGGSTYQVQIPASEITSRGLEFYLVATDRAGNENVCQPECGKFSIQVRVEGNGLSTKLHDHGTPTGAKIGQTAYRLLSVPLQLDEADLGDILTDDLGDYDDTKWRLFDFQNEAWQEYPQSAEFSPGKSYFIIVRQGGQTIDTGAGKSLPLNAAYPIVLHPGWNLVGNPFNFPLPKTSVKLASAREPAFFSYQGEWITGTGLTPWEGCVIFNDSTGVDTLLVNPDVTAEIRQPKSRSGEDAEPRIQIIARCEDAQDRLNFIGLSPDASTGWDTADLPEPPPIGEYVSLYFPHPEWKRLASRYSADFQPPADSGNQWRIAVSTNIPNAPVELEVTGLDALPAGLDVYLSDESGRVYQNLRKQSSYVLAGKSSGGSAEVTLMIGTSEALGRTTPGMPQTYELNQNYPNPFSLSTGGAATTISYGLPSAGPVTISVYNVLGARVASLVQEKYHEPGRYAVQWDGRSDLGGKISNGVYFYSLKIGNMTRTCKMLILY